MTYTEQIYEDMLQFVTSKVKQGFADVSYDTYDVWLDVLCRHCSYVSHQRGGVSTIRTLLDYMINERN